MAYYLKDINVTWKILKVKTEFMLTDFFSLHFWNILILYTCIVDWKGSRFRWDNYLVQSKTSAVPARAFKPVRDTLHLYFSLNCMFWYMIHQSVWKVSSIIQSPILVIKINSWLQQRIKQKVYDTLKTLLKVFQ